MEDGGPSMRIPSLPREPTHMTADAPFNLADKSQIGHMIFTMLETSAVGRHRLAGGSFPQGNPHRLALEGCVVCEKFVTGTFESCVAAVPTRIIS